MNDLIILNGVHIIFFKVIKIKNLLLNSFSLVFYEILKPYRFRPFKFFCDFLSRFANIWINFREFLIDWNVALLELNLVIRQQWFFLWLIISDTLIDQFINLLTRFIYDQLRGFLFFISLSVCVSMKSRFQFFIFIVMSVSMRALSLVLVLFFISKIICSFRILKKMLDLRIYMSSLI